MCAGFAALLVATPLSVQAESVKIGYVNVARLMQQSPQALAAGNRMRSEFSGQRDELTDCNEDLRDMTERMRKEGSRLGDIERERLNRRIVKQRRACRRVQDELREDFSEQRNKEFTALEELMEEVIQDIAKKEGYDLILSGPAAYVGKRIDLTDKVLDRLGKMKPASSGSRR